MFLGTWAVCLSAPRRFSLSLIPSSLSSCCRVRKVTLIAVRINTRASNRILPMADAQVAKSNGEEARPVFLRTSGFGRVSRRADGGSSHRVVPAGTPSAADSTRSPATARPNGGARMQRRPSQMTKKQQRIMTEAVVDEFGTRIKHSKKMLHLAQRMTLISNRMVWCLLLSLVFMLVALHCRLHVLQDGTNGSSSMRLPLDVLRGVNVGLTIALVGLLLQYHAARITQTRALLFQVDVWQRWLAPVLEVALVLIGVVPPGVEVLVPMPLLDVADSNEVASDSALVRDGRPHFHIDQLSVLMLVVRLPLLYKALIEVNLMASPNYIAWQYNVAVTPMFRIKYLFTQKPLPIVAFAFFSSWVAGTFIMHSLEYLFEPSLWMWFFATFDLMVGTGWSSAISRTVVSRGVSILVSLLGVLSIAILTATLCSSSELDATEVWLIRAMQRRALATQKTKHALKLIEKASTMLRLRSAKSGGDQGGGDRGHADRVRMTTLRAQFTRQARLFKRTRLQTGAFEVTNIKTLEGKVATLEGLVKSVASSVSTLSSSINEMREEMRSGRQGGHGDDDDDVRE